MYGKVKNMPITLETLMHPISPYAVSKMAAHFMITTYRESYSLFASNGVSIRLRGIVEYVFDKLELDNKLIITDETLLRPNEIDEIYGDNSKTKELLDWKYDLSFFEIIDILVEEEMRNKND